MKPKNVVLYLSLVLLFLLSLPAMGQSEPQRPTKSGKFNKHNNFKKTKAFNKSDNLRPGPPDPGGGDTGNPSPVSPSMIILTTAGLIYWTQKVHKDRKEK